MRSDLQAAVDILSALNEHNALLAPKGIAWADGRIHVSKESQEVMHRSLPIAITALRDMLKRREGCDFCNESEQIQNQYGDIMGMDDGVLILDTEGYPGVTFRIKYCPDCGRELSGNAKQGKEGGE